MWQILVRDHPALTPRAQHLAFLYATYMAGDSLDAWPSIETLMDKTGRSRMTVLRARQDLVDAGVLAIVKGGGRGHSTKVVGLLETVSPLDGLSDRNSLKRRAKQSHQRATNISVGDEHGAQSGGDPDGPPALVASPFGRIDDNGVQHRTDCGCSDCNEARGAA